MSLYIFDYNLNIIIVRLQYVLVNLLLSLYSLPLNSVSFQFLHPTMPMSVNVSVNVKNIYRIGDAVCQKVRIGSAPAAEKNKMPRYRREYRAMRL